MGPLEGIRVIDASRVLAGPFAAQVLAELGADVIKLESPQGDPARAISPMLGELSLYFASVNSGKSSVIADLRTKEGQEVLDHLLGTADVLIENFRPTAAEKLGVSAEQLAAKFPRLIVVSVTSYARDSGKGDEAAFDLTVQAESGLMAVTGEEGRPPVRVGVPIGDIVAGLWAALGALSGLISREKRSIAPCLEVPLLDATLSTLSYVATTALATGTEPGKVGSGHLSVVPYGAFPTRDGWVAVAVLSDKFWPPLCRALNLDALGGNRELESVAGRLQLRETINTEIAQATETLTSEELVAHLRREGVPHARVESVLEVLHGEYVAERGLLQVIETSDGSYQLLRNPLYPRSPIARAPLLGEHTESILRAKSVDRNEMRDQQHPPTCRLLED